MRRVLSLSIMMLLAVNVAIGLANGPVPATENALIPVQEVGDTLVAESLKVAVEPAEVSVDSAGVDSLTVDSVAVDSQAEHFTASDSVAVDFQAEHITASDSVAVDFQAEHITSLDSVEVETDSVVVKPPIIPMDQLREIENNAFGVGEKLNFEISYGPIKAGTALIEVKGITKLNGRDCYHVISTAKSNRVFSAFFKVEDQVESFFDKLGLFTWRFEQHLREGKYRADRFADYDQVNHIVTTNRGEFDIPSYVQDVFSTMYYIRTFDLEVGDVLYVDNHSGRKIYPLAVKVHRRERVEVPAGTFDCLVVEPMLKAGGLFKHEGKVQVWLTDDGKKMPVLMKTKVIIGTVDAKLKSYRLGKIL